MSTESIVVIGTIVVSIVVGSFSRVWGRLVGLVLVGAILGWGVYVYSGGLKLGFFGHTLEAPYFYGIAGALFAWELVALWMALGARRAAKARESACPACGSVETHREDGKTQCAHCQHSWM